VNSFIRFSAYTLIAALFISSAGLFAKTTFTVTGSNTTIPILGATSLFDDLAAQAETFSQQFQKSVDKNGPAWADAYGLSNSTGYATGKAYLGDFPHFEIGAFLNAGLTNTKVLQQSNSGSYDGTTIAMGVYPSIRFGIGLGGGFDFQGKFFSVNKDLYNMDYDLKKVKLKDYSIYCIGGRLRYNIIKEKTVIPFLFSFGGLTLSAGGDMMRGLIKIGGDYDKQFESVDLTTSIGSTLNPALDGNYEASITWYQLSGTAQLLAYFEIVKLFSLYTGGGFTVGYGWFNTDFSAQGTITDSVLSPTYGDIAEISLDSKNTYHPKKIFPTYTLGLELNIPLVKFVAESQVNLRNRADVTVTVGMRITL
jgi:hypothetical protein